MPSFKWDHDPIAFSIHLPFDLKYVLFVVVALGLISAVISIREKMSPIFGLVVAGVAGYAAMRWGDLQPDIPIRWYSLLFVGVFLGGYALLKWQIVRGGGDPDDAGDFIVYGVLGVLVGSRLGHVLFYDLDKAMQNPMWVLEIWTGGLASHGAVAGLILAMFIFTKRRGISFLEGADRFAFSAALGATLVRVGNFLNSEIVGRKVPGQTWGVQFPRYDVGVDPVPFRYPTQLFEVALGVLILLVLYLADLKAGKEKRPRGLLISIFFALYFPGRFLVEFWKEYQTSEMGHMRNEGLTMGQYLSIPGMLLGFYGIYWALNRRLPVGWKPREEYLEDDFDDDDLDDDLDDLDDEDEDEAPRPKKKIKKKTAKKTVKKKKTKKKVKKQKPPPKVSDDDEDEDEEAPKAAASKPADSAKSDKDEDDEDDEDEDEDEDEDVAESEAGASASKSDEDDEDEDEDDKEKK